MTIPQLVTGSTNGKVISRLASDANNMRPQFFGSTQSSVTNIGTYTLVQKILNLKNLHIIDSTFVDKSVIFINDIDTLRNKFDLVNYPPSVTYNDFGEFAYEWWGRSKKLTIYQAVNGFSYVKVWGTNIHTDMQDGAIEDSLHLKDLLSWMEY